MKCHNCDNPAEFVFRIKEGDSESEAGITRWEAFPDLACCRACSDETALAIIKNESIDGKPGRGLSRHAIPTTERQWFSLLRPIEAARLRKEGEILRRTGLVIPKAQDLDAFVQREEMKLKRALERRGGNPT